MVTAPLGLLDDDEEVEVELDVDVDGVLAGAEEDVVLGLLEPPQAARPRASAPLLSRRAVSLGMGKCPLVWGRRGIRK